MKQENVSMNTICSLLILIMFNGTMLAQSINGFDENGKRHGKWQKTYENSDVLRYEGEFFHGKEIGLFKFYKNYKNKAVLTATKQFSADADIADVKFFTSTGKLVSEGQMRGKTYVGAWKYYQRSNNNLLTLEHYSDSGELTGERYVYYPNEQVAEKQNYKQGVLHGESVWYSENGVLLKSYIYENGELDGPARFFSKTGQLICEGHYKNGQKNGVWKYYENDELVKEEKF